MNENSTAPDKPRYVWPWFVLAAILFGFVLALLWVGALVRRTREQRQDNIPVIQIVPETNAAAARTNP